MKKAEFLRKLAIVAMALLILIGLAAGNTIDLKKEQNSLNDLFYTEEYDGNTIDARISEVRNQAADLCGACVSYVGNSDAEYVAVQEAMDALTKSHTVSDKYYAMSSLCTASSILAKKVSGIETVSDKDLSSIVYAESTIDNISYLLEEFSDEYNAAVEDFNDSKNSFPRVLISFFIPDAEEFR